MALLLQQVTRGYKPNTNLKGKVVVEDRRWFESVISTEQKGMAFIGCELRRSKTIIIMNRSK